MNTVEQGTVVQNTKKRLDTNVIQKLAAFASLILLVIFFSFGSPYFFNYDNLITVIKQTAVIGIIAIGVTFVIITAGIDLSMGSVVAVAGVVTAIALRAGVPSWLGVLIGSATGALLGIFSGVLVGYGALPPFIATLGMMMSARGVALVLTSARPVYFTNNSTFMLIYNYNLFNSIPMPVIYLLVIAYLSHIVLVKTTLGRRVYAIGSNEEAARLSGINVKSTLITVYGISGLMSGLAGIILLARLNSGQPAVGQGFELNAIAAAVIGGTSLAGGEGTILGTIIGALIMSVLQNGLNLMHVSQFWQQVIIGLVVIFAVYIDIKRKKK